MNIGILIDMPDVFSVIMISAMLAICTYTDIKKNLIPLPIVLTIPFIILGYRLAFHHQINWMSAIFGLVLGAIPYLMVALMGKGGGGDVILMGMIGFLIGAQNIVYLVICTTVIYLIFSIVCWVKNHKNADAIKKRYPYAPFVTIGWICFMVLGYIF